MGLHFYKMESYMKSSPMEPLCPATFSIPQIFKWSIASFYLTSCVNFLHFVQWLRYVSVLLTRNKIVCKFWACTLKPLLPKIFSLLRTAVQICFRGKTAYFWKVVVLVWNGTVCHKWIAAQRLQCFSVYFVLSIMLRYDDECGGEHLITIECCQGPCVTNGLYMN